MSFVIYNKETTLIFGGHLNKYETERAAKTALTKAVNHNEIENRDDYAIEEYTEFKANIEKEVERTNLMSGEKFMEPINTPVYLSPAYESYWSM